MNSINNITDNPNMDMSSSSSSKIDSGNHLSEKLLMDEKKIDEKDYLTDILPSFQMHNFMFNRTLVDPYSIGQGPPEYEESLPDTIGLSTVPTEPSSYNPTLNDPSSLLLNNLDKLQKINLPFSVSITLTEDMPILGKEFKKRSPLKQYLPGDMVYGFIVFENKSKMQIPFEMLLVSMECEIGLKHSNKNITSRKKVLTTYDLEASFNFLGADGDIDTCHLYDSLDKTYVGFERRTLDPGVPIKKFFKFRIPNYVLDNCCDHQLTEHLKTPPSFGNNTAAFSNSASAIGINRSLGYGKLDASGSPVHAKDFALGGEYVSYYLNVQIIGTRLEAYKPFYKNDTTHQYDYIFIKNREYYLRVGKSPPDPEEYVFTNGTTQNQLDSFEKQAIETIEVLSERHMLDQINVYDIRQQDEIIFSSSGKSKSVSSSTGAVPLYVEKKLENTNYVFNNIVQFKRDLFSKTGGVINMSFSMDKSTKIQSFLPKLMTDSLESSIYAKENACKPIFQLNVDFEFYPNKSSKLPTLVTVKPDLIGVDINSTHKIPFNLDESFLLNDAETIKKKFAKFALYYNKICEMMKAYEFRVPKPIFEALKGLGNTKYVEVLMPHIFKGKTLDLTDKWVYSEESKSYKCSCEVPFEFDIDYISHNPFALLPSFQTCLFSRLYKMKFSVSTKKGKSKFFTFPVNVV